MMEDKQPVIAGPFPLVQGGVGMINRIPIYASDAQGQTYYWGLASVVVDPLPIFTETSFVWKTTESRKRIFETAKKWEPNWKGEGGEREEPAHRLLFDELSTVADLASSEFPRYADRLWEPILDVSDEDTV